MPAFIQSPMQKAFRESLSEYSKTQYDQIVLHIKQSTSVSDFIQNLSASYQRDLSGVTSIDDILERVLLLVDFSMDENDNETGDSDYEVYCKSFKEVKPKPVEEIKEDVKTVQSTQTTVEKRVTKKKVVAQNGNANERAQKAAKWLVATIKGRGKPVPVDELKTLMMEEFSMGGASCYKLITAYGSGNIKVRGLAKLKKIFVERKRAYIIDEGK